MFRTKGFLFCLSLLQPGFAASLLQHAVAWHHISSIAAIAYVAGYKDYLIDSLALHDHLHLLRPLMADPSVTKVLHGGANDVTWLQRDAHVYLVNVFDTEKAAQVNLWCSDWTNRGETEKPGCAFAH